MRKARTFNPTHLVFWITWLVSMAYWLGAWTYRNNAVDFDSFVMLDYIMLVVCLSTAFLSIVGCFFVFLNVTNLPCTLAYVIPMGLVVPALCVYGLLIILDTEQIDAKITASQVMKYWKEHGKPPSYMSLTERDLKCCGIFGPTDYRQFLYGDNCEIEVLDVPFTCCNLPYLLPKSDPDARRKGRICPIASGNIFKIDAGLVEQQTGKKYTAAELMERKVKCKVINNVTAVLDGSFKQLVYNEGCVNHLIQASVEILDIHYIFFIVFTVLCVIMTGFILQDCCRTYDDGLADGEHPNAILIVEEASSRPPGAEAKKVA
ncbi:unnamed protein product [Orchesella dallaii]|uniref:Tetraspanin n=1 Tax=Orchesella dallaii TaxID=48710 RepID=A0ABP1RAK4_9HEXA